MQDWWGSEAAMESRRILQVITDTDRRGAQIFAIDLEQELSELGARVTTIAMVAGARGAQLRVPSLGTRRFQPSMLLALRREMRNAELVVAHGSGTLIATVLAGAGLRRPLVYRNISDPAYWLSTRSRRWRVRWLLARTSRVVALWPGGAEYLVHVLGVARSRVTVIPNGVRSAAFRPPSPSERSGARREFGLSEDGPVLLFIAALRPEKHPEVAVEALVHLPSDYQLLILGDGPGSRRVRELAELVAPGRVVFAGQLERPQPAYWASDVLVLPSEGEGLPAVLIEAGLSEVPSVASDSGGNRDIVVNGQTGAIVPVAAPQQLAESVLEVMRNRHSLGAAARAHCAGRYESSLVGRQWFELITSCLRRSDQRDEPLEFRRPT